MLLRVVEFTGSGNGTGNGLHTNKVAKLDSGFSKYSKQLLIPGTTVTGNVRRNSYA